MAYGLIWKIKKWWALRKAKKLEKQKIPTMDELKKEQEQFVKEAMSMKPAIMKKRKARKKKSTKPRKKRTTKRKVKKK